MKRSRENMNRKEKSISYIFTLALGKSKSQEQLSKNLLEIFSQKDIDEFRDDFLNCVQHVLIADVPDNILNHMLEFISAFSFKVNQYEIQNRSKQQEENLEEQFIGDFLRLLFKYFSEIQFAKLASTRWRICYLIGHIISQFQDEDYIDTEVSEMLTYLLLKKLQDKKPFIRIEAAKSLQRFQDPTNDDCRVLKAYIFYLTSDPSEEMRKSILKIIAKCQKTLPFILERMKDNKASVRKMAFLILAKINIRSFSIKQRVNILNNCLTDPDDDIKKTCSEIFFVNWLSLCNNNFINFLKKFDIEQYKVIVELIMTSLLKNRPEKEFLDQFLEISEDGLISPNNLDCEAAFFWRMLATHFHSEKNPNFELILPELTPLTQYISNWFSRNKHEISNPDHPLGFIFEELIELSLLFDGSDEMGRLSLRRILVEFLQDDNLPENLVPVCVKGFSFVEFDTNSFITGIAEIISEIQKPLESNIIHSPLGKINDEENLIAKEVKEERTDIPTLCKISSIIISLLETVPVKTSSPSLDQLINNFIERQFQGNIHLYLLIWKIRLLHCLFNKDQAKNLFIAFMEAISSEKLEISKNSIECVFDLLLYHGPETFGYVQGSLDKNITNGVENEKEIQFQSGYDEEDEDDEKSGEKDSLDSSQITYIDENIISPLRDLLGCYEEEVRYIVVEGFMKLHCNSRINSPSILMQIIIISFNPTTESIWKEKIHAFLKVYIEFTSDGQATLHDTMMPTIKTIVQAPPESPLALIDIDEVFNLFINLTDNKMKDGVNLHNSLILLMMSHLIHTNNTYLKTHLIRAIKRLNLDLEEVESRREFMKLLQKGIEEVYEESILKELGKLLRMVSEYEIKDKVSLSIHKSKMSILSAVRNQTSISAVVSENNFSMGSSIASTRSKRKPAMKPLDESIEDSDRMNTRNNSSMSYSSVSTRSKQKPTMKRLDESIGDSDPDNTREMPTRSKVRKRLIVSESSSDEEE